MARLPIQKEEIEFNLIKKNMTNIIKNSIIFKNETIDYEINLDQRSLDLLNCSESGDLVLKNLGKAIINKSVPASQRESFTKNYCILI